MLVTLIDSKFILYKVIIINYTFSEFLRIEIYTAK
ncbi:hypothetical protein FHS59_000305 [Algoriphagus iocasae]|uniref:Uncharacterized protein n=1 Tax=Algoriphagus iocasae TaxID=1836499 RepID=A0A841MBK8_9BACT|nr:hypothetical protein [Algoriphagus iocasae]